MASQFKGMTKKRPKPAPKKRLSFRALSAIQRFPVIEWGQQTEELHKRSIHTGCSLRDLTLGGRRMEKCEGYRRHSTLAVGPRSTRKTRPAVKRCPPSSFSTSSRYPHLSSCVLSLSPSSQTACLDIFPNTMVSPSVVTSDAGLGLLALLSPHVLSVASGVAHLPNLREATLVEYH